MSAATLTLTDFLLARITEDEEWSQEAAESGIQTWTPGAWDPVRVVAECGVKREIVEQYQRVRDRSSEAARFELSLVLLRFARIYADHPDYREEWKS